MPKIEISGVLRKAENVRIEDDVVARDEDEYCSCVIDCLDYGDQTKARELAEIGDVSDEAEAFNEVVQLRPLQTTVYTCSTIDSQIFTLTNDTNVSMGD